MEPFLRNLVRLQELSLEVARLNARISQIPQDIEVIDREESAAAAAVSDAKQALEASKKTRKDMEGSLQDLEQKIVKYNDQSREVKTNDQYRAIMNEIEGVKNEIGKVEEGILVAMEESDNMAGRIKEAESAFAGRKKEFEGKRDVFKKELADLTAQKEKVEGDLSEVRKTIPPEAMETYNRTAKLRGEIVMAAAQNERCQVCNVRIRPQTFAEIRKNDSIINCESCRRIFYYVPAPAKEEGEAAASESSPKAAGDGAATGPDTA